MVKENVEKKRKRPLKDINNEEMFNAFHVLSLSVIDLSELLKKNRKQFHRKELPDPKWNVMTILEHGGPQTVPQIARSRKISRQGIQNTVNRLYKDGHVAFIENPAHKKSPLVCLTPKGKSLGDEMNLREKEIISKIHVGAGPGEMLKAAKVIRSIITFFESKQWKDMLEKSKGKQ